MASAPAWAVTEGNSVSTMASVISPAQGAMDLACKVRVTLPKAISAGLGV